MSTTSNIGIENNDGSVDSIYCNFDGYLSHVGKILLDHYSPNFEQEDCNKKIRDLINLGDISFLAPEIGEKHDFNDSHHPHYNNWVLSYKRDRGDKDIKAEHYDNVADFLSKCIDNYIYLLRKDGKWEYSMNKNQLETLTHEVINNS